MQKNLVIKASAGTGKTYRLSLEYVKLLLLGESPKNIIVTTFTKKASFEIKERIIEHLETLSKGDKALLYSFKKIGVKYVDFKLAKKIYSAILFEQEPIRVNTIDSFINDIFNKFVVPYYNFYGYKMVSDDQNSIIVEELLEKLVQTENHFNEMEKFFQIFLEKDITSYIKWINEFIENRWKFILVDHKKRYYKRSYNIDKSFNQVLSNINALIKAKRLPGDYKSYLKDEFKEISVIEQYRDYLDKNFSIFLNYVGENNFWDGSKLRKSKSSTKEHSALIESYQRFKKNLSSYIFNNKLIKYEKEIFKFASTVFKGYDKIKSYKKEFTYNDIVIYTYMFLEQFKKDPKFIESLTGMGISHILIDEFQDTSVMQWAILNNFIEKSSQFIAVGDSKQAIYGWRGGEQKLFENLQDILGCKVDYQNTCYRTKKNIVEFNNRFFSGLGIMDKNVRYLPSEDHGYVEVGISNRLDIRKKLVSILKERGFKDATILARNNIELEEIAVYLRESGIPFVQDSSSSLVNHRAVKPIISLLKFILKDDILELIKFLRSDIVRIPSYIMKRVIENRSKVIQYVLYNGPKVAITNNFDNVVSIIKHIKEHSNGISDIKEIIGKFNFINVFNTENDLENLEKFFELSSQFTSLNDFIVYISKNNSSDDLKQVSSSKTDGIRLMTIHKSKGLEFENVILAWTFTARMNKRKKLLFNIDFNKDFTKVLDYCFITNDFSHVLKYYGKNYSDADIAKYIREEINALYVAMTRAKSNLIALFAFDRNIKSISSFSPKNIEDAKDDYLYNVKHSFKKATSQNLIDLSKKNFKKGELFFKPRERKVVANSKENLRTIIEENRVAVKKLVLEPKNIKKINFGILAHYFLSNIVHADDSSINKAAILTESKFSDVFTKEQLRDHISFMKKFINSKDIFDTKYDSYNEVSVFSEGKEYRIDRVNIDRSSKVIDIIDYKTGYKNIDMLSEYIKIIKDKYPDYNVKGRIVEVK